MRVAQDRQQRYANKRRRDVTFSLGDSVLLSTKNLRNAPGKARKFLPRYVGPFKVTGKLGEAAYRLELPPTMSRLHPVFHVSLLKKYTGSQGFHPPPVMEWLEDAPHYEVHSLLNHRQVRFKKRMEYLVKWTGYDDTYNTWEPEAMLAGAPQILSSGVQQVAGQGAAGEREQQGRDVEERLPEEVQGSQPPRWLDTSARAHQRPSPQMRAAQQAERQLEAQQRRGGRQPVAQPAPRSAVTPGHNRPPFLGIPDPAEGLNRFTFLGIPDPAEGHNWLTVLGIPDPPQGHKWAPFLGIPDPPQGHNRPPFLGMPDPAEGLNRFTFPGISDPAEGHNWLTVLGISDPAEGHNRFTFLGSPDPAEGHNWLTVLGIPDPAEGHNRFTFLGIPDPAEGHNRLTVLGIPDQANTPGNPLHTMSLRFTTKAVLRYIMARQS
ncbi:hypothetical protein QJQ45_003019 [Haematococcus lacustris]|nr:hypothetical protein QJQ45_003019 [Haematococcus lacustris]